MPTIVICIFIGAIQQVRHLGRTVDEESNKNDIEGKFCSQKLMSLTQIPLCTFSVTQSLFVLVSHKALIITTASSNKKSTSKKKPTSVSKITM